jgi:hypothetical protein
VGDDLAGHPGMTNFRSTPVDAQICVDTIVELGERLEREQT